MGIEKIGLPARPAAKGRTWVLDASSCQACQTPFSLFNRKHHCRRCGGLFCGNCSNSKVTLRGQGDSAVRVCEPCKKLEEAARFQARNRGKPLKGASKVSSLTEDDTLLKEALGDSVQLPTLLDGEVDGHPESEEVSPSKDKAAELKEESPEKLREQALEQKKIYYALKREGKNTEALQAFKRHKELGREADAIELSLKKLAISQRKALAEGPLQNASNECFIHGKEIGHHGTLGKEDSSSGLASDVPKPSRDNGDDDLLKALKDLGWNEADLNEKNRRKGPASDLELLAEISGSLPKEASSSKPIKQNPTQLEILAHKRKALALKREGKQVEAKEELRKAKLLEKKLEEMALFGDEEEDKDDDDELAALMRSLDKEAKTGKGKEWSLPASGDIQLPFRLDDDDDEANIDVTEDDVNDPGMIAALQAMGWVDEAAAMERSRASEAGGAEALHIAASMTDKSRLQNEILTYKRRALALKREGKLAEAKAELQEAKVLEQKLEALKSQPMVSIPTVMGKKGGTKETGIMRLDEILEDRDDDGVEVDDEDLRDPDMMAALKAMGFQEDEPGPPLQTLVKPSPQEKKNLQDEILSIKRSALALKKHGKSVEAKEELRHAKVLEQKLLKMQSELEMKGLPAVSTTVTRPQRESRTPFPAIPLAGFVSEDEEEEVEVSADDFMDPELVAALKSVGWQEEDTFVKDAEPENKPESPPNSPPVQPYKEVKLGPKEHARKLQLQKELLAYKRKALALKREGKVEEAELQLNQGKVLEKEIEEIEHVSLGLNEGFPSKPISQSKPPSTALPTPVGDEDEEDEDVTDADMQDPELLNALKAFGWKVEAEESSTPHPAPLQVDEPGLEEKVHDAGPKLDATNPPYTRTVSEPESDPIWFSIMRSASKNHPQVHDATKTEKNEKHRDYGETGSSVDTSLPLFDYPSPVSNDAVKTSAQRENFDLLSSGPWEEPVRRIPGKDENEEEDDVFDSGLLAALQSIGLEPPSKDGSLKQFQGEVANVKGQTIGSSRDRTGVESRQQPGTEPLSAQKTQAEATASGEGGNLEKVGSFLTSQESARSFPTIKEAQGSGIAKVDIHPPAPTVFTVMSPGIQEEIRMHKRKALTLKREGKQSEAREELRQAKLLEKQLEIATHAVPEEHQSPTDNVAKPHVVPSSTSPEKQSETILPVKPQAAPAASQTHKEQLRQEVRHGKDRMKLQQESLAHKRKALGLRREGKVEEADAEFELAKSLEKQMEELDAGARPGQSGKGVALEAADFGMVEDLLDPQLMAALKGLGFNDGDLHGGTNAQNPNKIIRHPVAPSTNKVQAEERVANTSSQQSQSTGGRSTSVVGSSGKHEDRDNNKSSSSQQAGGTSTAASRLQVERRQLEARIKQEKVKALELKRAGRQGEALEVLRGAKLLEKQLVSIAS